VPHYLELTFLCRCDLQFLRKIFLYPQRHIRAVVISQQCICLVAEYLSRYFDSLRAWRSCDLIPTVATLSPHVQTCTGAHIASSAIGTGSLYRGYSGRGVALISRSHLVPRLMKGWSYTFTPPLCLRGGL